MTDNRDLLFTDICARLKYNVKVRYKCFHVHSVQGLTNNGLVVLRDETNKPITTDIKNIQPYLFPLSSLTEKQRNEISQLLIDTQNTFSPYGEINTKGCDNLFVCSVKQSNALIKYCLMHHLDINGLIEKGLAIDASGLNIY